MTSNVPPTVSDLAAVEPKSALMSIPLRHRRKTLETYDPSASPAAAAAARAAIRVAEGTLSNLVLVGRPGAGKSHLAAAICNAVHQRETKAFADGGGDLRVDDDGHTRRWPRPAEPMWANVPALIADLKSQFRTQDRDAELFARQLGRHRGLVVLDDLGRERVTEWTGEVLYVLVNHRYESRLPTVVTSNLTIAELADNGYEPLLSRLAEDGALIEMASAVDYRTRRPAGVPS